jgi:hypothetical protein
MKEPAQVRTARGGAADGVEVGVEEEEEPPRSATVKQEEANAVLGAEGSRPFAMRELKEDHEVAAGSGVKAASGERNGVGSADAQGSSYRFVEMQSIQISRHVPYQFDLVVFALSVNCSVACRVLFDV